MFNRPATSFMSLLTRMLSLSLGGWLPLRESNYQLLRGWRCVALFSGTIVVLTLCRMGRNLGIINDVARNGVKAPILMVALAFAVTLGLSILSLYLLEMPMAKLKDSFGKVRLSEPTGINAVPTGGLMARFAQMAFTSPEDTPGGPQPAPRPQAWGDQARDQTKSDLDIDQ